MTDPTTPETTDAAPDLSGLVLVAFPEAEILRLSSVLLSRPENEDDPQVQEIAVSLISGLLRYYGQEIPRYDTESEELHLRRCQQRLFQRYDDYGYPTGPSVWSQFKYFLWTWGMPWFLRPAMPSRTARH